MGARLNPKERLLRWETFCEQAKTEALLSVKVEYTSDTETPVGAFSKLVSHGQGFLLESVEQGERWSRYSFVGRRPLGTLTLQDGELITDGVLAAPSRKDVGVFEYLREQCLYYKTPPQGERLLLESGFVGYLGYDTVREVEDIPATSADLLGHPDAHFQLVGDLAIFDHWRQKVTLIANVANPPDATKESLERFFEEALARVDAMAEDLQKPLALGMNIVEEEAPEPAFKRLTDQRNYMSSVEAAREFIFAGDIFQVVLSQRFEFDLHAEPFELYRVLRQVNPSPYMYFLQTPSVSVVGSSPEALVKLEGRKVTTRPIAGTRRRGKSKEEDLMLAAELAEHPKEVAEHVMLVDLARNDIGRIASFGTETVDELMTLEYYSHVMHMTSQVSAEIREDIEPVDVLMATLPAGTLSGAPKVRAMEIIDSLENYKRGVYGGVVGYLDFVGNLDVAIAIRTAIVDPNGRAYVQAGAGIVADSDPGLEDLECVNKARALLHAAAIANASWERRSNDTGSSI